MTLYGPDGAVYQEGIRLTAADWDAIDFGIWRCIHQSGRVDRSFAPMRDHFTAHRKPFAAYVWVDGMDPQRKADFTMRALGNTAIPVMVDWEDHSCPLDRALDFVHVLRSHGYRVPLLYTGRGFWQAMGRPTLAGYGLDLVVARYGNQVSTGTYETASRYRDMVARYGETWDWLLGGLRPVMWQFGSRVRWGDRYMDMNAIREPAELGRWFRTFDPPPPPITPPLVVNPPPPPTVTSFPTEDTGMLRFVTRTGRDYWLYTNVTRTPIRYPGPTDAAGGPTQAGDLRLCALLMGYARDGVKHGKLSPEGVPAPIVLPDWEWPMFDAAPVVAPG